MTVLRGISIAALAAFALALGALALAGCGGDDAPEAQTITIPVTDAGPSESDGDSAAAPDPDTGADAPPDSANDIEAAPSAAPPAPEPTLALDAPKGAFPVIWVRAGEQVEMRTEPGGGELVETIGRKTEFGSPTVFGVIEQRGGWAGVSTELLANGRLGWIKLDAERLEGGWTKLSIEVDLSAHRLQLLDRDKPKRSFTVTIGAPGSETPTGRYSVTDTFADLNSAAYGCCAVALSATQPNLPSGWLGGRRIAIHGTSGPLGIAASHGCVRAADAEVAKLVDEVPLGTPVFIRA